LIIINRNFFVNIVTQGKRNLALSWLTEYRKKRISPFCLKEHMTFESLKPFTLLDKECIAHLEEYVWVSERI
jgi:hypothetical protein